MSTFNSNLNKLILLYPIFPIFFSTSKVNFQARNIKVPRTASQALLPAIAVNSYLKKLQKCNFNLFDKSLHIGNSMLPFKLYYNRILNRY